MMRVDHRSTVGVYILLLAFAILGAMRQERVSPNYTDFDQFYLGATIARAGAWDLLYPVPHPNAIRNAGIAADQKPGTERLWREVQGKETRPNFIYPPVAALLLRPLAYLDYSKAKLAWQLAGGACVWGIAVLTGRILRVLWSRPGISWAELAIVAAIVLTRRSLLELNHGNISQVIGVLIAGTILALLLGRTGLALPLVLIAAGLKVSPACLLILFAIAPSWTTIRSLACCAAVASISLVVTGLDVWVEYLRVIAPTLSRTWLPENRADLSTASIHGVIALATPNEQLPWGWPTVIYILSAATIIALAAGYLRDREMLRQDPARLVGFAAGVVAWSLFFSPILWYHYWFYYLFCVPWLLTYFRPIGGRTIIALAISSLMFGPWGKFPPFNSSHYAARLVPGWICIGLLGLSLIEAAWPRERGRAVRQPGNGGE